MARKQPPRFNPKTFLEKVSDGIATMTFPKKQIIFSQGDAAHAVFYIHEGQIKLSIVSQEGKEAVIAILDRGNFLGEGCLAGQLVYMTTATSLEPSTLIRIDKRARNDALHNEPAFSEQFLAYLLARNIRVQEDLVDQLFNSSEKRLARVLLLMAHFGKEGKSEAIIPKISQEVLAEMIGTTRSRVSFFMNKFRKLGFLDYKWWRPRAQFPPQYRPPRLARFWKSLPALTQLYCTNTHPPPHSILVLPIRSSVACSRSSAVSNGCGSKR